MTKVYEKLAKLDDLIVAPLLAVLEADFKITKQVADFILKYGFEEDATLSNEIAQTNALNQKTIIAGKLRFVTFVYYKTDYQGTPKRYTVNIPVISLIPIPGLKISNAQFSFNIRVTAMESKSTEIPLTKRTSFIDPEQPQPSANFIGFYSLNTKPRHRGLPDNLYGNIKATICVKEMDLPPGVSHLLQISTDTIYGTEASIIPPVNNP